MILFSPHLVIFLSTLPVTPFLWHVVAGTLSLNINAYLSIPMGSKVEEPPGKQVDSQSSARHLGGQVEREQCFA